MAPMTSENQQPFTVLIAGGSITGLTLALLLSRAGINYVVLERGSSLAPQLGASLGLHPPALSILDQLGLWENDLEPIVAALHSGQHFTKDGKLFGSARNHEVVHKQLGYPIVFIERQLYLETLLKYIPEEHKQTCIHTNAGVADVKQDDNSVTVTTTDGRTFHGDVLIGGDGVHSMVRELMNPALKEEYISEFNCIFGISNVTEKTPMQAGMVYNVYDSGISNVCASGVPGKIFWFLFKKNSLTHPPNVPRFTDADTEKMVEEHGDMPMCADFTIKDLWETRDKAVLVALEEGVISQWIDGRVLLMGDSAHKVTINAGFGGNTAIESTVLFSNSLHKLLQSSPHPSSAELKALFKDFESVQRPRANQILKLSATVTRLEAQNGLMYKLLSRYVMPRLSDKLKAGVFVDVAVSYPDVEFLPKKASPMQDLRAAIREKKEKAVRGSRLAMLVKTAVAVGTLAWLVQSKHGIKGLQMVRTLLAEK